jgi:cytoskeletal protein RodZ
MHLPIQYCRILCLAASHAARSVCNKLEWWQILLILLLVILLVWWLIIRQRQAGSSPDESSDDHPQAHQEPDTDLFTSTGRRPTETDTVHTSPPPGGRAVGAYRRITATHP